MDEPTTADQARAAQAPQTKAAQQAPQTKATFRTKEVAPGIWQLSDLLNNRAYLVVGATHALLVDTMGGYGNLPAAVASITDLPLRVVLTHNHQDHVSGAYGFDEVCVSAEDDCAWEREREFARLDHERLLREGKLDPDDYWAPREGSWPRVSYVRESDTFDLGDLVVEAIALPGHTRGSMGYLVRERGVLLLGDAITPIMCLFFKESLTVPEWIQTIDKLEDVPFDVFYTGHHDVGFAKAELASFRACAEYALADKGLPWAHMFLPYEGTLHMYRGDDADAPDFRALIGPYVPRPRKARRRRKRSAE